MMLEATSWPQGVHRERLPEHRGDLTQIALCHELCGEVLKAREAISVALGVHACGAFALERTDPFESACQASGDDLEEVGIDFGEVPEVSTPGVENAEQTAFKEHGDGDDRTQSAVAEGLGDHVDLREVRHDEWLAAGDHLPGHALARLDAQSQCHLFAEPRGGTGNELVAGLVGDQNGQGVGSERVLQRGQRGSEQRVECTVRTSCRGGSGDLLPPLCRRVAGQLRHPLRREQPLDLVVATSWHVEVSHRVRALGTAKISLSPGAGRGPAG